MNTTLVLNGRTVILSPKVLDRVKAARIRNAERNKQIERDLRTSGVVPRSCANTIGRSMPVVPTDSPVPSVELNTRATWQADKQKARTEASTPASMEARWQKFLRSHAVPA